MTGIYSPNCSVVRGSPGVSRIAKIAQTLARSEASHDLPKH